MAHNVSDKKWWDEIISWRVKASIKLPPSRRLKKRRVHLPRYKNDAGKKLPEIKACWQGIVDQALDGCLWTGEIVIRAGRGTVILTPITQTP